MCCGSDPANKIDVLQLDVSDKALHSYYRFIDGVVSDDECTKDTAANDNAIGNSPDYSDTVSIDIFRSVSVGESIYGVFYTYAT